MKDSAGYAKIVEYLDEDQCYVGRCPGLFLGGCHRLDERVVFDELCQIVEETVASYMRMACRYRRRVNEPEVDRLWLEEARRRYDAYCRGYLDSIAGDEALARARTRLK